MNVYNFENLLSQKFISICKRDIFHLYFFFSLFLSLFLSISCVFTAFDMMNRMNLNLVRYIEIPSKWKWHYIVNTNLINEWWQCAAYVCLLLFHSFVCSAKWTSFLVRLDISKIPIYFHSVNLYRTDIKMKHFNSNLYRICIEYLLNTSLKTHETSKAAAAAAAEK